MIPITMRVALRARQDFKPAIFRPSEETSIYYSRYKHDMGAPLPRARLLLQVGRVGCVVSLAFIFSACERISLPGSTEFVWKTPVEAIQCKELLDSGDPEGAVDQCAIAQAAKPEHPVPFLLRAEALGQVGRHEEAIVDATQAIELAPRLVDPYITRAQSYTKTGQYDLAFEDFDRAIEILESAPSPLRKHFVNIHTFRSELHLLTGNFEDALSDSSRAIELSADYWPPYTNKAAALVNLDRLDEALTAINEGIALMPHEQSIMTRAQIHWRRGDYEEMLADANRSLEGLTADDPDAADNFAVRALAHTLLGNPEASEADMETARAAGLTGSQLAAFENLIQEAQADEP